MATMQRGGGDEAVEDAKPQHLDADGGPRSSKGDASACGEVMPCDPDTVVSFNCRFHENAMRGAGDAFFEKAPLSPIPPRVKPIYMDDRDFIPEELKMQDLPDNGYIAGDLGRHGYVFRRAPGAKLTLANQPPEPKEAH